MYLSLYSIPQWIFLLSGSIIGTTMITIVIYYFVRRNHYIKLHQWKALDESFPSKVGILVDVRVQKLTPHQSISHHDPAIATTICFC